MRIIDLGLEIKHNPSRFAESLQGQSLIMIFQKTSTRTRVSFEVGMTELGGHAIFLDWRTTNIPISDLKLETEYLSRNCSFLMARMLYHRDILEMAGASSVPVINGLDDKFHPTQVLSDFMTITEKRGNLKGARLLYIGVLNNVANSIMVLGSKLGVNVLLATPLKNEPSYDSELIKWAEGTGFLQFVDDPKSVIRDVDAVYVDTWLDMEFFANPSYAGEKEKREAAMLPLQLNQAMMEGSKAMVMHDMPVHAGYEISSELVHDPRSIILDQAENLRHARKAILMDLAKRGKDTEKEIL